MAPSDAQKPIVDQAGASDASSKKSHGTATNLQVFQRIERFRAGDLCIVESGQWLGFYRFPENLSNPAGLSFAGGDGMLGVFECSKKQNGGLALGRIQIAVATAHRGAVRLSNGRAR